MQAERWRRVETLFHRCLELEPAARAAWLRDECGADLELHRQVEQLLADDERSDDLFARVSGPERLPWVDPLIGRTVGAYRLVARIAAGGMGVVYRAERSDGLFAHEVAIKWIRAELSTPATLRRFEFERRTLAALQHPCIARLLDGGTADDGRPYLVMEFVRGVPIDRHCERERLTIPARLRLFAQVCRAVHFAHQNLVVHRDLKPGNILIDAQGLPRLLDFGIARLLESDEGDERARATLTVARTFTPEYASPEQLTGGPVTTAIDIYALGVILYELLTGRRPFQRDSQSPADWERLVQQHAPTRPSSAVLRTPTGAASRVPDSKAATPEVLAARFGTTPAALRRRLRGDLDRIVLMALRKEPERRFASAQEFAEDIERHLAGLPVRARGDSLGYRSLKFVQRNRLAVAASTAIVGALVAGFVTSRRSEAHARAEAEHARIEANSFQSIADFLMDAFLPVAPAEDEAWQHLGRERILAQAARLRRQYAEDGHTRANMLDALGQVCLRIDLFDDAEALLREALEIRAATFGPDSLEYALSLRSLGQLDYRRGDVDRAAEALAAALALNRSSPEGTHTDVAGLANDLAACLRSAGRGEEAEALHREALELRSRDGGETLPVAESLNNLAGVLLDRGDFAQGATLLEQALAIRTRILGAEHALTLQTTSNLAALRWQLGQRDEALALTRTAEHGYRALGVDGEAALGGLLANLAEMQLQLGELDGAEESLAQALDLQRARLGPEHPQVAVTLTKLANLNQTRGQFPAARELWLEVLEIRRAPQATPRDLHLALYAFGVFLSKSGACDEALEPLK
ncbi:MAG: tetratricopeptide repeat protein, partial [Planctomycetota bacterium]